MGISQKWGALRDLRDRLGLIRGPCGSRLGIVSGVSVRNSI